MKLVSKIMLNSTGLGSRVLVFLRGVPFSVERVESLGGGASSGGRC